MQQLQPVWLVRAREMEGRVLERPFSFDGLRNEGLQGLHAEMTKSRGLLPGFAYSLASMLLRVPPRRMIGVARLGAL